MIFKREIQVISHLIILKKFPQGKLNGLPMFYITIRSDWHYMWKQHNLKHEQQSRHPTAEVMFTIWTIFKDNG